VQAATLNISEDIVARDVCCVGVGIVPGFVGSGIELVSVFKLPLLIVFQALNFSVDDIILMISAEHTAEVFIGGGGVVLPDILLSLL
jgi:hypothetical protein